MLFLESVRRDEVVRYWSLLDASIIHLKKNELFKTVIPSKLFECMAMGIPVVHGVEGESATIVSQAGVGLAVPPEDPDAIVTALRRLCDDDKLRRQMSRNGTEAARRYDRRVLADRMVRILSSLTEGHSKGVFEEKQKHIRPS